MDGATGRIGGTAPKGELREAYNWPVAMEPDRVERTLQFLVEQQVEFAGGLQRLENSLTELREFVEQNTKQIGQLAARLGELTGLVQTLAQLQVQMLQRQTEMREEMDRRFAETDRRMAETDRRMAETDERIRRLAALIQQGFQGGNGSRA